MRIESIKRCAAVFACGLVASFALQAEAAVPTDFKKSVDITLKAALSETEISSGLPALVKLSAATVAGFDYADFALPNGGDMMFTDADGNVIPHEVDTWNANGESLVWVKLPSTAAGTKVVLYYGKGATSSAPSSDVWSDYSGVWHFETLDTSAPAANSQGTYVNSTAAEGIEGNLSTSSFAGETGRFGNCFKVNDSTSSKGGNYMKGGVWVNDAGEGSPLDADGTFTISGWFKHQNWNYYYDHFFAKRSYTNPGKGGFKGGFAIEMDGQSSSQTVGPRGGTDTKFVPTYPNSLKNWSYITFVYSGTTCTVYQNGALVGSGTITKATDNDAPLVFGNTALIAADETGDAGWAGWIDEVRYLKDAKSAEWIAAEYAAMTATDIFEYGAAEDVGFAKSPVFEPASGAVIVSEDGLTVTLTSGTAGATIYYTTDGSDPTEASLKYESPMVLTRTTTVKAFACKEGLEPSDIVAATYVRKNLDPKTTDFKKSVEITLKNALAESEITTGLPALVRLSEAAVPGFSYADFLLANGEDLMFTDAEGEVIPHEVDTWNEDGESLVWVKLPSTAAETTIVMYYGNGAVSPAPASGVWGDYTGVWHFETLDTSVKVANSQGTYANSTASEGIDGNLSTSSFAGEAGRFGNCFKVNDSTGKQGGNYKKGGVWVNDAGTDSPVDGGANFTISGWFKHKNFDYYYDHFFYKRSASGNGGSPNNAFAIEADSKIGAAQPLPRGSDGKGNQVGLSGNMKDSWSYLTFAFDGAKCHVYENGAFKGDSGIIACIDNDCPLIFGDNNAVATGGGDAAWNGWIDEVRFAKGTKSADFIAAEYAAMNVSGEDAFAFGEVKDVGPETTADTPRFEPKSETMFYPTTNVALSCKTEGATIRYTTDGSDPTEASAVYVDEIVLPEATTTVKARAFKAGLAPSEVASATYEYTVPVAPVLGEVTVKARVKNATVSGMIESVGNLYATACDVYLAVGTSEGELGEAEKVLTGVTDAFKYKIAGLEGETTYYYALSISNNATFVTGAETRGSFTTLDTDVIEPGETPTETRQTIQDAIDDAAEEAVGGTVTLMEGLFEIDEQLVLKGGITLVGQGWTNTVIRQTSVGETSRCVTVRDGSKLVGVTLTGGSLNKAWEKGAGALVEDGTVSWCCISNNVAGKKSGNNYCGGGICVSKGAVDHTIIAYNTSAAVGGGASHGGGIGVYSPTGPVVIDTCLVFGNKAPNGNGGGLYADFGNNNHLLTLRNTTIVNNSASSSGAGGVHVTQNGTTKNIAIVNCILADNSKDDTDKNLSLKAGIDYASQCFGNVFANGTAALGKGSASYPGSGAAWFVDEANGDCHLRASSPASDSGVWYDGIVDDLDGVARPEEKMSSGCYECTEVDHGVIKLSPIDVATTTTSATASGSIVSLGEGASATVTLRVGPNFEELAVAATATNVVTDFALTASGLTHATRYAYEITVENDKGRTATASGEFFTQYDPEIALLPSADPAANVATLSVAFAAAAQTQATVTLGEGVFEINAPLTADGGITVVGQGWDKTTLKQGGAGRVITLAGGSTLKGVAVTGGNLTGSWEGGAGVLVEDGTVSWCSITDNKAIGNNAYGGGVNITKGTIDHSVISGNQAGGSTSGGGGIACYNKNDAVVIDTCLVYGNTVSSGKGGGVCFELGVPDVALRNTTITGNSAGAQGGGLYFSTSKMKLENTIVSWNAFVAGEGDMSGTPADGSTGNLIGVDPKFKDAANGDYRLPYASPANRIGHWYEGIAVDLDGRKRSRRPAAGCYEIFSGLILMAW